jgi:hypothetical protein
MQRTNCAIAKSQLRLQVAPVWSANMPLEERRKDLWLQHKWIQLLIARHHVRHKIVQFGFTTSLPSQRIQIGQRNVSRGHQLKLNQRDA